MKHPCLLTTVLINTRSVLYWSQYFWRIVSAVRVKNGSKRRSPFPSHYGLYRFDGENVYSLARMLGAINSSVLINGEYILYLYYQFY